VTLPHAAFCAAFSLDTFFHAPIGPAHTSGACANDERTTADVVPSRAIDAPTTYSVVMCSAPRQSVCAAPPFASMRTSAASPPTTSPAVRCCVSDHDSVVAEAFMSGVRLRAAPVAASTSITSPPVEPSSLINPSMSAIDLPSGDQRGSAICNFGV
jgi:hypothetical protein